MVGWGRGKQKETPLFSARSVLSLRHYPIYITTRKDKLAYRNSSFEHHGRHGVQSELSHSYHPGLGKYIQVLKLILVPFAVFTKSICKCP